MVPSIIFYSLIMGVVICNACTASVYSNGAEVFKYLTFGGWIAAIIFFAICFAIPIFIIYCSVTNIKQGKAKDIPFIGRLRLISRRKIYQSEHEKLFGLIFTLSGRR